MFKSLWQNIRYGLELEDQPKESIDPRARKAWGINGTIKAASLLIVAFMFFQFSSSIPEIPAYVRWAVLIIALAWMPVGIWLVPLLRMRYWRYDIREDEIDIQHGILIIKRTLIPMIRVQHVDTEHGPVLRHYGLATLKVSTAASNFQIPALSKEKAGELRGEISALANVSDEDV